VLTHELGHVLFGLAHPCSTDGRSAPLCTADDRATSIMHPEYAPGAWAPHADDVAGACALSVVDACAGVSCDSSEQCVDGECLSAPSCVDGSVCVDGACAVAGPGAGMCTSRDGLGVACVSGADCASRRCLTVPRAMQSYCTRACGADSECGPEERCRLVDGAYVCGPPPPSGCAAAPRRPAAGWSGLLFAALSLSCYRRRSQ
jgi:hypothetical protein